MKEDYLVHIKPKTRLFDVNLKEILSYKDLIFLFVRRNLKLRYAQTILGPLWLIITPFITSIVYTFIFGDFAGIETGGVPHMLFYMSGTVVWALFSGTLTSCSATFTGNLRVFGKVYFPRLTTPISQSITGIINFCFQLIMFVIIWVYYLLAGEDLSLSPYLLIVPLLVIQSSVLATSIGLIITSWTVKYKDFIHILSFGMQLWMFLTPIIYPLSSLSGLQAKLILFNPVTPIINNFRYAVIGQGEFLVGPWVFSIFVTIVCFFIGVVIFNRTEKTFADLI